MSQLRVKKRSKQAEVYVDVQRFNPQKPSKRPSLATLPRLQTSDLSPGSRGQRLTNPLSSLYSGARRSWSGMRSPSYSGRSSTSPRPTWPSELRTRLSIYLDLNDLLQLRLVNRRFEQTARKAVVERYSDTVLPRLMTADVRRRATKPKQNATSPFQYQLDAPFGKALLANVDRLALKHTDPGARARPLWRSQMLLSSKLFACPNLTKLHLSCNGPMPSSGMIYYLGKLHTLRFFSLTGGDFTPYDLADAWGNLRRLETLAFSKVRYDKIEEMLAALANVRALRLAHMLQIPAKVLKGIVTSAKLETLELVDDDLNDADLEALRGAKTLKHLDLSYNRYLTPSAVSRIAPQKRGQPSSLEQLIIAGIPLDEVSFAAIGRMKELRRLWMPDSFSSLWSVHVMSQAPQLQFVVFREDLMFVRGPGDYLNRVSQPPLPIGEHAQERRDHALTSRTGEVLCDIPIDHLEGALQAPCFTRVLTDGWRKSSYNSAGDDNTA